MPFLAPRLCVATFGGHRDVPCPYLLERREDTAVPCPYCDYVSRLSEDTATCRFLRCDYVSRLSEDTAVPCPYLLEFVATA